MTRDDRSAIACADDALRQRYELEHCPQDDNGAFEVRTAETLNVREIAPTSSLVSLVEEERRERAELQALRERIVRQERHGARPPALPLQGVRPQPHGRAAPRQAAGDEGAGGAALRP